MLLLLNLILVKIYLIDLAIIYQPKFYLISLSIALITAGGYIINDFFDIEIDKINKPNQVIIGKFLSKKTCQLLYYSLNILAIFLISLVSIKLLIVFIFSILLLYFYANSLKKSFCWGNILVAVLSSLPILVLTYYYQTNITILCLYAYFAFGVSLIREIIKDIADLNGDSIANSKTLPIVLGIENSVKIVKVLYLIFIISFVVLTYYYSIDYGFYSLLFAIIFAYFFYKLFQPIHKLDFNILSQILKIMMLIGVLSMIFVKF